MRGIAVRSVRRRMQISGFFHVVILRAPRARRTCFLRPEESRSFASLRIRNLRGPHRCFLCPGALSVALLELFGCVVQRRGVAAAFVLGYAGPVESLRRGIAFGQRLDDVAEAPLGFIPLLPREG
jgi:hypothetical protein